MDEVVKLIKITWLDHCSSGDAGWKEISDVMDMEPVLVQTVGWLLKETEDRYIVASTISDSDGCAGDFLILKATVKNVEELK